jgi:hypothetical protein
MTGRGREEDRLTMADIISEPRRAADAIRAPRNAAA